MARTGSHSAFSRDVLRTVRGSLKRFVALATITALGVTMLTGLRAACVDLRNSADAFFDDQGLFDVRVQSTLGLTDDDVEALGEIEGVEAVEGGYVETAYTTVGSVSEKVDVKALSESGMNEPLVLEGRLPETEGEIAVTQRYLKDSGLSIGDTVSFHGADDEKDEQAESEDVLSSESTEVFERRDYTIVGSVLDPTDVNAGEGTMSFRSSGGSQYSFFVTPDCVTSEAYTVAYLVVEGASDPLCYSAEYEGTVDAVKQRVEDARGERERARGEGLRDDATKEVDDAEAEALAELADAEQEIAEGQAELDDGRAEVADGQAELDEQSADALAQLDDAQAQLDDGRAQLDDGAAQLADGRAQLAAGIEEYNAALPGARQQLIDGQAQLDAAREEFYATTIADLEAQRDEVAATVDSLSQTVGSLDASVEEMAGGLEELAASAAQGGEELGAAAAQIRGAWDDVRAAQDGDEAAAQAAVSSFAEVMAQAAETLEPISQSLSQAADALRSQADELAGQVRELDAALEQLAAGIDQTSAELEDVEARIAELEQGGSASEGTTDGTAGTQGSEGAAAAASADPRGDGELEALLARREELIGALEGLRAQQTELQGTRDSAQRGLETLHAQLAELEGAQEGLRQIIALGTAGPGSEQSATSLASGRIQAGAGLSQARAGLAQIEAGIEQAKAAAEEEFSRQQALIDQGWQDLRAAYNQLVAAQETLDQSARELADGYAELESGQAELDRRRADALEQLADVQRQLDDALAEIADGQAELDDARATFESERDDALAKIADARAEVEDIPDATWYVQDRSSLSSYASVDSDASSIEAIGTVIPIVFFVVAVLISLTTMTRMVEEERGLIGVYKALGYSRGRILSKYALYALAACVAGALVGNVLGFVVLPAIIFTIFSTMYALPGFMFGYDAASALVSFVLFAAGIVGATLFTCWRELHESPADLMRPKAPRAGSRILLERLTPVWSRLSFLNKVTARNLFRYKRRFLMTVFGVAGCVALLITGFGIRDTVLSLSPRQYGDAGVTRYDLMVVSSADDLDAVLADLGADSDVEDLTRAYVDSLTVSYGDDKETVQLVVVPEADDLEGYVSLAGDSGQELRLTSDGAVITKNAEQVMGFALGDELALQDSTLAEGSVRVDGIALNYLSNTIFMTADAYEAAFGDTCEMNGALVQLRGSDEEQIELSERLTQDDRLLSVVSTAKLVRDFSSAFTLINTVVYVVIVLAAALSFTVVFTLSNTNISERERELATLKVLGFKRPEVYSYINKETLILTGIGVVLGMPIGYALARSLTWILRMPSLYFDVVVDPLTYAISAALAFVFTLMVNLITNRALDRIDMVGALKSAE